MPDCPPTIWKADNIDIDNLPAVDKTAPHVIDAAALCKELSGKSEVDYFIAHRDEIVQQLQDHGAIHFRNFELMKDPTGFRTFFEALKMNACLDPIHTSGLREM